MNATKTAALPTNSTQTRSFRGACSVYRRFNKGFFNIARPHNDYLRKQNELDWFDSATETFYAFSAMIPKELELPVPSLLQPHRPYMIDIGATRYVLPPVLPQQQNDSNVNKFDNDQILKSNTQSSGKNPPVAK